MSEPDGTPAARPPETAAETAAAIASETRAESPAGARLTVHRTASWDEQSRQILCSIDGTHAGQLLFGQTLTRDIPAGSHTLKANNTLVWKTVPFEAAAGEHVHFTVWNEAMGGWWARLLFVFVGAAALKLGITPGPPRTRPEA